MLRALVVLLALALAPAALAAKCPTVSSGKLTVGTDNPAYPPWFGGKPPPGSPWKVSDPRSGEGYEAAVAYAVATQFGFKSTQVEWKYVPFNRAFAPGPKPFDFDINQISFTSARAKVVSFSSSYYDENQAVVVLKGTKIAGVRTLAGLAGLKLRPPPGDTDSPENQDKHQHSKQ